MSSSTRRMPMFLVACVFSLLPFVFGFIRLRSANDIRMLWMAAVATIAAMIVVGIARARAKTPGLPLIVALAALVVATIASAVAAYMLGATATFGVWAVAFVLALSSTLGCVLSVVSRIDRARA